MKRAFAWAMALGLSLPTVTSAEGQNMTEDQKAVLAAVETMTSRFMDGDIPSVMQSYEAAATVLFEPAVPVDQPDQLAQMFAGMAAVKPVFVYPSGHEVVVQGDIALHISPWSMTGEAPDGQKIAQQGLSVAVLRKQADGSWKMVIDNPHGGHLLAH